MSTTTNIIAGATLTAALVGGALLLDPEPTGVVQDGGVVDGGQQGPLVYFIATDGRDVVHCGSFDPQTQQMSSGQPIVHQVATEAERDAIAASLGVACPRDEQDDAGLPDAGLLVP